MKHSKQALKVLALAIVLLILLTACTGDGRDEIVGRWRTAAGTTTIEFSNDGTARLEGREVTIDLNYAFVDDNQLRVFTEASEEIWAYTATSEELDLTTTTGQEFTKIQVVDWRFVRRIFPDMLDGLFVTIQAAFLGFILALIFGFVFALGRRSTSPFVSLPVGAVVEFVRSTPLLAQLFFFFFVLPRYGIRLPAFQVGVVAIGLHYGTYCSEVYRAGINAVPKGQWEAATALNFSTQRTWLGIILPQALPPMIPAFGNYLVAMFKETAQLSAITISELLLTARVAGTDNFRFLEPITMVGAMYFAVSYPSSLIVQQLEKRYGRKNR